MTKQDFIHLYGQSVYQVRLQVAIGLYGVTERTPDECMRMADEFCQRLLNENIEESQQKP